MATRESNGGIPKGTLIIPDGSDAVEVTALLHQVVHREIYVRAGATKMIDVALKPNAIAPGSRNAALHDGGLRAGAADWNRAASEEDAMAVQAVPATLNMFAWIVRPAGVQTKGGIQDTPAMAKQFPVTLIRQDYLYGVIRFVDPPGPGGDDPPARVVIYPR